MKNNKNTDFSYIHYLLSTLLFFLSLSPAVSADYRKGEMLQFEITKTLKIELPGYYRFRYTDLDAMLLSEIPSGGRIGEQQKLEEIKYTEHRWRLEPKVFLLENLSFHSQIDLLTGMLSGARSPQEYPWLWLADKEQRRNDINGDDTRDFAELHLKRYWGRWESPIGILQLGRQGSHWGLGLAGNNGEGFENDFGDAYYGDNVDRVLFGTKPYSIFCRIFSKEAPKNDPVTTAFGYDWHVARDSNSKRGIDKLEALKAITDISSNSGKTDMGDDVHQYLGIIKIEAEPFEGGFYIARRIMEHPDIMVPPTYRPNKEFLRAWIFDFYGKVQIKPDLLNGGEIFLEGELSRIVGETNLTVSKTEQQPLTDPFPVSDISQLGWVLKAGVRHSWVEAKITTGYASGDSNPFDSKVKNFKFHPDFNVGLILFESLLANVYSASAYNAINRFDEGGPIKTLGADLLPSNGSVTNAFFLNPTVKIRPKESLEIIVGILWAQTATDYVDPTMDGLFGGGAGMYNPFGAPSDHHALGCEADLSVSYTWEQPSWDLVMGLQYGHFFPGNVFENSRGKRMKDINQAQLRLTFLW